MYNYDMMLADLKNLTNARIFSLGKTLFGREIFAIIVGVGNPKTLIHGGIHGRENITSRLVVRQARVYSGSAVCFVPMVNPDGVQLAELGLKSAPQNMRKFLTKANGDGDFKLWKANGRAVDINVNFNADWGNGLFNANIPSFENYIGKMPESEVETKALIELTKIYKFKVSASYHAKGEVIYCGFQDKFPYMSEAMEISNLTGYPLLQSLGSAGGFKDWFVLNNYGLGLTIEVGDDRLAHPLQESAFAKVWRDNKEVAKKLCEIGERI
ncbi:MAG: M14 family zinc carboxypeptidase [Clostridia bacterium]